MWGKFKLILLDNNVESCRSISRAFYGKYAIIKNDTRIRYHFPVQAGMIPGHKQSFVLSLSIPRASGAFLLFQIDKNVLPCYTQNNK